MAVISAEEIISWGGNDTKWIGAQLAKLCTGLLSRRMYNFMYKMMTEYSEYPIYHKHVYILEIMRHVSDNNVLWDCIARMENYIKQNKEAKSFNLSVEPGRELVKKTILDVLELIQNDILLDKMLTRYKEESLDEKVIKKEIYNFKEYLLEKKDRIEKADSVEILDILYKLTGEYNELFHEFAEGGKFLHALQRELHNIRRYKVDYLYQMKDLEIFQYDKLEKEVLTFKNKVIITSVKNLREVYLEKMSNATSDSEYEFLRDKLINEISEIINKDLNKVIYEDIYNDKKVELISIFNGEKNWMKLDKTTQDFLVSGEIVYDHLLPLGDKVDYSAAVIPLTKALENEIYIYFHREFVNYCNAKGAAIPPSIQEVTTTYFSLNSLNKYAYDLNYTVIAKDYLPTMFKGGYVKLSTNSNEKQFIKDVNNIRINYRNKVAHKEGISKQTAVKCRENMLLIKKMLFKFINGKK